LLPELNIRPKEAGIASLASHTPNFELEASKHKIHWLWFPYVDISLIGPDGLRMRLGKGTDYYGVGRPGHGNEGEIWKTKGIAIAPPEKRAETKEDYDAAFRGYLLRCTAIPIWDIQYYDTRFNHNKFSEEEDKSGNSLNSGPVEDDMIQLATAAGVCAADFVDRYEVSHGARVLKPLIGMEADAGTAYELFKIVQPRTFKLTNLKQERDIGQVSDEATLIFDLADNGPAHERIMAARLDSMLAPKAHEIRRIMRGGVMAALVQARRDYEDLLFQLGNSKMGQTGFKKVASPYDRQLCYLLGEPVPASIAAPPAGDTDVKNAVLRLTEIAEKNVQANMDTDSITLSKAQLDEYISQQVDARLSAAKQDNKKGNGNKPKEEQP
jgi:hypothetical protein